MTILLAPSFMSRNKSKARALWCGERMDRLFFSSVEFSALVGAIALAQLLSFSLGPPRWIISPHFFLYTSKASFPLTGPTPTKKSQDREDAEDHRPDVASVI